MTKSLYVSPLARALSLLKEDGKLSLSKVPKSVLVDFNQLVGANVLGLSYKKGRRNYFIAQPNGLASYIEKRFPGGLLTNLDESISLRVKGILETRNSKSNQGLGFGFCLIKAAAGITLTRIKDNAESHIHFDNTIPEVGSIACHLENGTTWQLSSQAKTVVTIENADTFVRPLSELPGDVVVFADGKMSKYQIDFVGQLSANAKLLHFGDYDPVGLSEYLRLKDRVPSAELYIPDNIKNLFKTHATKTILLKKKNQELLASLRGYLGDPYITEVLTYIDENNACLEQESLYIPPDSND